LSPSSEKIIIINGAGISVNAGYELKLVCKFLPSILIYLVPTFKDMRKSKQTSFDRSLYSSSKKMINFHSTIRGVCERLHSDLTEPSAFHKVINELAWTCPHFRHYTQNIDYVERLLPDLDAKTVRLYGRVNQARYEIYN
jgi:NAD-dependent SIR2 family protein deacetylase